VRIASKRDESCSSYAGQRSDAPGADAARPAALRRVLRPLLQVACFGEACRESRAVRLLIQADHVPARVTKPCSDLGCVTADRLDDLAPSRGHLLDRVGDAVDHHVDEETNI
jgi:hypothetical protein